MKSSLRLYLMICWATMITYNVDAQRFSGFASANMTFNQISGDLILGFDKLGFRGSLGAFYEMGYNDQLIFGIHYASGGSTKNPEANLPPFDPIYEVDFWSLGPQIGYRRYLNISRSKPNRLYLQGLFELHRILAKSSITSIPMPEPDESFNDEFQSFAQAITLTLGYQITENLSFRIGYNNFLSPIIIPESQKLRPLSINFGTEIMIN